MIHFTLDTYLIMPSVKQGSIKNHFESLVWLNLGLNPGLPDHWRTLDSLGQTVYSCILFKEINSEGSFQVPENYQYDLLYKLLRPELFSSPESQYFQVTDYLLTKICGTIIILSPSIKIFYATAYIYIIL